MYSHKVFAIFLSTMAAVLVSVHGQAYVNAGAGGAFARAGGGVFYPPRPLFYPPPPRGCAGQFRCDNGQCVPIGVICNGSPDCADGSDERNCQNGCQTYQFRCDNGQCVPGVVKCNGRPDCADGSDERNCQNRCKHGEFQCNNGQCVPGWSRCDGVTECSDKSDERNCPPLVKTPEQAAKSLIEFFQNLKATFNEIFPDDPVQKDLNKDYETIIDTLKRTNDKNFLNTVHQGLQDIMEAFTKKVDGNKPFEAFIQRLKNLAKIASNHRDNELNKTDDKAEPEEKKDKDENVAVPKVDKPAKKPEDETIDINVPEKEPE